MIRYLLPLGIAGFLARNILLSWGVPVDSIVAYMGSMVGAVATWDKFDFSALGAMLGIVGYGYWRRPQWVRRTGRALWPFKSRYSGPRADPVMEVDRAWLKRNKGLDRKTRRIVRAIVKTYKQGCRSCSFKHNGNPELRARVLDLLAQRLPVAHVRRAGGPGVSSKETFVLWAPRPDDLPEYAPIREVLYGGPECAQEEQAGSAKSPFRA